jgi:hypothetical protein
MEASISKDELKELLQGVLVVRVLETVVFF